MKKFLVLILLATLLPGCKEDRAQVETIVFVRHGEKSVPAFHEQLNCRGLDRSLHIPQVLYSQFGIPDYIFAPSTTISSSEEGRLFSYNRPLTTILPTAIQLNKPVNVSFDFNQDVQLAHELLSGQYHNSLIFAAWEHHNLVVIFRAMMSILGLDPSIIPDWPSEDFDSIYILRIVWDGQSHKATFTHGQENLNSVLSDSCPQANSINHTVTEDETIYFIPSAESEGYGQLNCQGLNRALGLQNVLTRANLGEDIDVFISPSPEGSLIYQNNMNNYYFGGLMTLDATVINQRTVMYTPYGYQEIQPMTNYLLAPDLHNKHVAIAWEISLLSTLAQSVFQSVGGDPSLIPSTTTSHDVMYKITITRDNGTVTATNFTQLSENLNPSPICLYPIN